MADEADVGCARPTGGPVGESEPELNERAEIIKEERTMVMVGQKRPGFCSSGLSAGEVHQY